MYDDTCGSLIDESLFDALDDILFVFDEDGTLAEWNQTLAEVTGYSDEQLGTMAAPDFFEGEDVSRVRDAVMEVREEGEATIEAGLVTAEGERILYEFQARKRPTEDAAAYAGIGRDITERVDRREQVEHRERVLREMYEIIADRERPFSEQVEALLALGRDEFGLAYGTLSHVVDERYLFEVVDADDDGIQSGDVSSLSATNCERVASTEETLALGDVERDAPDETSRAGHTEWGISSYIGVPVYANDSVYGTLCFYGTEPRSGQFSDWEVTLVDLMGQWVSYELQRQERNDRLERQNEKLDRYASIVSHDLRSPLNVVVGSIELARETGDLGHLERARRATARMDSLTEDLLTLARSGETVDALEPVDLGTVFERCWRNVSTADASFAIETERTVRADRTRLRQLLENLLGNAVEHAGADVTVTLGDLPDGFYVEDDGPGIPEGDRREVFEGGYTTTSEGTGFGLAIVREVVDAHDWHVRVTDGSDGGARFEFTQLSTTDS
jgi:PAS domain S-box-containing protein